MESFKSLLLIIVIVCGIIFIFKKIFKNNYKFKFDTITHFQGSLGSGKTTLLVHFAKKWKKKQHFKNRILKILNKLFFNKFKYVCEDVYSNFPIYFGRKLGWSKICNKGIWTWQYRVPEGCLIVYDELSNDFPNTKGGQAVLVDDLERFTLRWSRHAFDYTAYTACQSLSEVNKNFRQKVQHCYTLSNLTRGLFNTRVNVVESFSSEDIKTIYNDTDKDHEDNVYKFRNIRNAFDSRYGKEFYDLSSEMLTYIAFNTDKILLLLKKKPKDYWDSYEYNILISRLEDLKKYEIKQNTKKDS